jgi:tetratricopeptide (TPR) repeat protein
MKNTAKTAKKTKGSRSSLMARRAGGSSRAGVAVESRSQRAGPRIGKGEQSGLFEKAISFFHKRDFERARGLFEKAAEGPVREIAHSARTHARMCSLRTEQQATPLVTSEDYYNYGVALLNQGDFEAAGKYLEHALRLAPNHDHIYYAMALCCGLKGDIGRAYANLRRAVELQPRNLAQARNDPDFAEFVRQPPLEEYVFSETDDQA